MKICFGQYLDIPSSLKTSTLHDMERDHAYNVQSHDGEHIIKNYSIQDVQTHIFIFYLTDNLQSRTVVQSFDKFPQCIQNFFSGQEF